MAFKREGDSQEWLALLKKRRVSELFAEDIPEDEAFLMKNGRFCCTVCGHRPIFDTALMLAHHRHGKKHVQAAEHHLQNKLELENLRQKRQHEQYETGAPSLTDTTQDASRSQKGHHTLLTAQKYTSTVKKAKSKPGSRKPKLQLDSLEGAQTIAEYQRRKLLDDKPVHVQVRPYKSKREFSEDFSAPTCVENVERANKQIQSSTANNTEVQSSYSATEKQPVTYVHPKNKKHKPKHKISTTKSVGSEVDVEKKKTAELYLQARGAGWKKSLDGTWVRDEDVEFDSDEEPPDLP